MVFFFFFLSPLSCSQPARILGRPSCLSFPCHVLKAQSLMNFLNLICQYCSFLCCDLGIMVVKVLLLHCFLGRCTPPETGSHLIFLGQGLSLFVLCLAQRNPGPGLQLLGATVIQICSQQKRSLTIRPKVFYTCPIAQGCGRGGPG